jgi:hypothetical protein
MGGAGFGATLGGVGRSFMPSAGGGMRAGMGMLGGGLAGAAAMALPYAAVGGAISTVGSNIQQGAQNISEVGMMAGQYMGPQFGQAGARDGQMGRQTIRRITGVLHEMVGDDMASTMDQLKNIMDKAGRMGMLSGIQDAQQFKDRFGKIVNQVRAVANVMGSTLDEAMPMFAQMRQMGMWTAGDVMGTATQARVAGAAAPQMMQTMQAGAQMSFARGGTITAGAQQGRAAFGMIQAAGRAGSLSEEELMNLTGGVGGVEGQQMVAQQLTNITSRFGQSDVGQLMLAGLGERREGRFTGQMDPERLRAFQEGRISVGQLQSMGQRATRGREGAMSFFRQRERLGQRLGAQGGVQAMQQAVQRVMEKGGFKGEEARHQIIQQLFKVGQRESELMGRLFDEMPRIMDQQSRETEAAIESAFRQLDDRQNRSWAGLKDAVSHRWGEAVRPIQEFGERLATGIGTCMDRRTDAVLGNVQRIPMGSQERARRLQAGGLTADVGINVEAMGGVVGGEGVFAAMIRGARGTSREQLAANAGIDLSADRSIQLVQKQQAYQRARGMREEELSDEAKPMLNKARSALRSVVGKKFTELQRLKEEDPSAYGRTLAKYMDEADPDLRRLPLREKLNLISAAQAKEGYAGGAVGVDFARAAVEVGISSGSPEQLAEMQRITLRELGHLAGEADFAGAAAGGAAALGVSGGAFGGFGAIAGAAVGAVAGLVGAAFGEAEATGEDFEKVLTGEDGGAIERFMKGDLSREELSRMAAQKGQESAFTRVATAVMQDPSRFRGGIERFSAQRMAQVQGEGITKLQQLAERAVTGGQLREGGAAIRGETAQAFDELLRSYRGREVESAFEKAETLSGNLASKKGGRAEALSLAAGGGTFGRQIAAMTLTKQLEEGSTEAFEKKLQTLRAKTGIGIDAIADAGLRESIKEDIKSGGKVTKDELTKIQKALTNAAKTTITEQAEARKSMNQRMMEKFNEYALANTRFVDAVGRVLGDKIMDPVNELKNQGSSSAVKEAEK